MKFYVISSDSENINAKVKSYKAYSSLLIAKSVYDCISKQDKYRFTFLVADFGVQKRKIFQNIKMKDNNSDKVPFLIIAQYDSLSGEKDMEQTYRKDNIRIISDGFVQDKFRNNFCAVKTYIEKISNVYGSENEDVELCVEYYTKESGKEIHVRTIDSNLYHVDKTDNYCNIIRFNINDINGWLRSPVL